MKGLEVLTDPLLVKVFGNLIDNSRCHGELVRHISFSSALQDHDSLILMYEEDGVREQESEKERILRKDSGNRLARACSCCGRSLLKPGLS